MSLLERLERMREGRPAPLAAKGRKVQRLCRHLVRFQEGRR